MPIFLRTTSKSLEHLPARTDSECRDAWCLECLVYHHHFLLRHTFKVRRVLVQSERVQPPNYVVKKRRAEIFFVLLRAAVSCAGSEAW
jgi:hypothetical protein